MASGVITGLGASKIVASVYGGSKELLPSTPALPPRPFKNPDIHALCEAKLEAITRYASPLGVEGCAYCGKPMTGSDCRESPKGDVERWCSDPNGCGRKHVVYTQPEISVPKFRKACVFSEPDPKKLDKRQRAARADMVMAGDGRKWLPHPVTGRFVHPDEKCASCGKKMAEHSVNVDVNGWEAVGNKQIELPEEWPVWNEALATWEPKSRSSVSAAAAGEEDEPHKVRAHDSRSTFPGILRRFF